VGDFHVTLHHRTNGKPSAEILALIGKEVTVTYTKYVKATSKSKSKIFFWMVDEILDAKTGQLIRLPSSELFHITDQALLRSANSASAAMAREVMKEICDSTPKKDWRLVITPSFGRVSGIIKKM